MNLGELLREHASLRPEAAAIIESRDGVDRILTFAELEHSSGQGAALLRQQGLRAGDFALVLQPMSATLYSVLISLFRLGAIPMFLDPGLGRAHVERCCEIRSPAVFIGPARAHFLRLCCRSLRRIPIKFSTSARMPGAVSWSTVNGIAKDDTLHPSTMESPALLTFTTGSTGEPKAALRTHGFLLAQREVLVEHLRLEPGEVDLTTLPVFLLANLAAGVTSVIPDADLRRPGAIDPRPVLRQIEKHRITRTAASPAFIERLLHGCRETGASLKSFRKIHTGGAPVLPGLLDRIRGLAPNADVTAVYGSTEAEPIALIEQTEMEKADREEMLEGRGLPVGKPIAGINLRVIRDQWGTALGRLEASAFAALCLPPGSAGEIVVNGRHVLPGYLDGRGDDETKFHVNGTVWHRTGDAGYLDSRGRLWLLGRCSARIDDPHGVLYPFSVECVARSCPGVSHAAMISHRGCRMLVVEADDASARLTEMLNRRLDWACIDEIRYIRRIPLDTRHNAKIDYPALKRLLQPSR
ncbi:MAG TPA: AMP-binding protein [Methylomirabilota bacterium]|nr:AMP-binding protein [Methylomirabilota bacterium]